MAPSKKEQAAFMAMMDGIMSSTMPCTCSTCKSQTKKLRQHVSHHIDKDGGLHESKISISTSKHLCPDHKDIITPRRPSSMPREKDKASSMNAQQQNRSDKVNALMKADSVQAVLDVFKATPTTSGEKDLSQRIQNAVSECKLFAESKAKIIELCFDASIEPEAVFGLVAKFRQERSLLTTAIIKSNAEREKALQAVHRVDDLMGMIKDFARDNKGWSGDELRDSLGSMMFEIHELANNPSILYDELLDLREEHLDLLADHDKFLDIESCHEKLHEKNKKLQEDYTQLNKDYTESKKKLGTVGGLKNDLNRLEKALERGLEENAELKQNVTRLTAELAKANALKHENVQLKKKLALTEVVKPEVKLETKTEPVQASKKKKGKKGTDTPSSASAPTVLVDDHKEENDADLSLDTRIQELKETNIETHRELDTMRTHFRQLEVLLKKAEVARTRATEQHEIEQATSASWKELCEGHVEESNQLRGQLDESISNATKLQDDVHQLEQNVAELKEQIRKLNAERSVSPDVTSQSSSMTRVGIDSLRTLQKLQGETLGLVQSLSEARTYPGDPWNVIECAQKILIEIGHDLDGVLVALKHNDPFDHLVGAAAPSHLNETGLHTPGSLPRNKIHTSTLTTVKPPPFASSSAYRPLLPPGLGDVTFGRGNPKTTHIPSPIGTGRPVRNASIVVPSPTLTPASTAPSAVMLENETGTRRGTAGVDWSMWSR